MLSFSSNKEHQPSQVIKDEIQETKNKSNCGIANFLLKTYEILEVLSYY